MHKFCHRFASVVKYSPTTVPRSSSESLSEPLSSLGSSWQRNRAGSEAASPVRSLADSQSASLCSLCLCSPGAIISLHKSNIPSESGSLSTEKAQWNGPTHSETNRCVTFCLNGRVSTTIGTTIGRGMRCHTRRQNRLER